MTLKSTLKENARKKNKHYIKSDERDIRVGAGDPDNDYYPVRLVKD